MVAVVLGGIMNVATRVSVSAVDTARASDVSLLRTLLLLAFIASVQLATVTACPIESGAREVVIVTGGAPVCASETDTLTSVSLPLAEQTSIACAAADGAAASTVDSTGASVDNRTTQLPLEFLLLELLTTAIRPEAGSCVYCSHMFVSRTVATATLGPVQENSLRRGCMPAGA